MQALTENQKDVARVVERFAEKFKVDVVLYESDLNSDTTLPNGQYNGETNTVYLDVMGGANSAEDAANLRKNGTLGNAMVQYLGHELTHALEAGSAAGYAAYRQAVKEAMRKRGTSYEALVRARLEQAARAGQKLTLGGAEAEVIANASEFMLENTEFISNAPGSVKNRVKKVISDFAKKVRSFFATLTGGSRESQSLREMKNNMYRYVDNLQRLWDVAAMEMVEGAQNVEKSQQNAQETTQNVQESQQNVQESQQYAMRDTEYLNAVEAGDTEEAQRMVDEAAREAGYTIRAYHGTGRADRVGTVFRADRATSGPMAFFTSDPQIAANYARDKADTSLAYDEEYSDYYTQFRINKNGKSIAVKDLWRSLSFSEKQRIKEAGKHITWDDDMENIIWDDDTDYGVGNFDDYTLHMHKGNAIEALVDSWLESGELYGHEGDFLQVLELAGIKGAEYRDPDARHEKVYDTYLKIQNPFNTATVDEAFIEGYEAWYQQQPEGKYDRQSADADMWDKNSMTAERFVERLQDDLANGTTNAWTSIPDSVTDYLKSLGHDGIQDMGGKQGGDSHTVWIPFTSEQIKDSAAVTYDDAGKVIPLSERFNQEQQDIRFSLRDGKYDYSKSFAEQVDDWKKGNFPTGDSLLVGRTSEIYRKIGLGDLPMTINQTHVDYIVNGTKDADHFMGEAWLKKLPEMLENPVAVIGSDTNAENSVVVILSAKIDGKQIIAPVYVNGTSTSNSLRIDSNNIASVYGKGNAVAKLLANALQKENAPGQGVGIYYWKKSEARSLLSGAGLQLPGSSVQDGLIHSIFDAGSDVNSKMFTSQTETRQFKRWFGNSEVTDEDGNPLVVYHTTRDTFHVFDRNYLGRGADVNATDGYLASTAHVGFWFNTQKLTETGLGDNAMPVYLSAQRLYEAGTLDGLVEEIWNAYDGEYDTEDPSIEAATEAGENFRSYLESRGYDGIMVDDTEVGGTSYIVFEPEQIKSATDNVGTFDPQNPDIRYARRDDLTMADVREILSGMEVTDRMNATEKDMLTRYKAKLLTVQDLQTQIDQQKAIIDSETATADEKASARARMRVYTEQPGTVFSGACGRCHDVVY